MLITTYLSYVPLADERTADHRLVLDKAYRRIWEKSCAVTES